ncbi:hypothetical protein [Magnetococcus sp. PR-3]|uniref:hypothetical protein n=1 Tax=Magnetococcus sp. PR-3 TaxID=3120355 RepID=UPI002FCE277D
MTAEQLMAEVRQGLAGSAGPELTQLIPTLPTVLSTALEMLMGDFDYQHSDSTGKAQAACTLASTIVRLEQAFDTYIEEQ